MNNSIIAIMPEGAMWRRFFYVCLLSCATEVNAALGKQKHSSKRLNIYGKSQLYTMYLAYVKLIILPVTI